MNPIVHIGIISNTYINLFKIFIINPPALYNVYEVYIVASTNFFC